MIKPLLFLFLGLQSTPQQAERQIQQLDRQEAELVRQGRQLEAINEKLGQIETTVQKELKAVCSAEVRWQDRAPIAVSDVQTPVVTAMHTTISAPLDSCAPAEVRITATYLDSGGRYVCSGFVVAVQRDLTLNTYFEFRPMTIEYFSKWRDGPTWEQSNFHRLVCYDYEGIEVREPGAVSRQMRLLATVFPRRGGLASAEVVFDLPRPLESTQRPRGFIR